MAIGSNLILKDNILLIEARKPFLILETTLAPHAEENAPIEPENIGSTPGQNTATSTPDLSFLLAGRMGRCGGNLFKYD